MNQENKPWYKKWWGIIIALFFLPLFVIYYAWLESNWSKKTKKLVTAGIVLIIVLGGIGNAVTDTTRDNQPAEEEVAQRSDQQWATFDVIVDDIPSLWNEAIDAYDLGYKIPNKINAEYNSAGLDATDLSVGDGEIFIAWDPETRAVSELGVYGTIDNQNKSIVLTATAAAMVYTVSDRSLEEASTFVENELMADVDDPDVNEFTSILVEEEDATYRFTLGKAFGHASWTVNAQ